MLFNKEYIPRLGSSENIENRDLLYEPHEIGRTVQELAPFFEAYYKNQGLFDNDPEKRKNIYAVKKAETVLEKEDKHFYTVEVDGRILGTAVLEVKEVGGEKRGFLSGLTVASEERSKKYGGTKLSEKLTAVRMEKAKSEGCQYVDTTISVENPDRVRALAIKFNDAYIMQKFGPQNDEDSGINFYWLSKSVDGNEPELEDVENKLSADDFGGINEKLASGWVGVRVENEEIVFKKTKV